MPKTTIATDDGNARGGKRNPLRVASTGEASFRAVYGPVTLAQNGYMAVIFNTNTTYDVVIQAIYVIQGNLTAVTGVIATQQMLRISAFTTANAVTPKADDPETDTLPSGVSADYLSTSVTDSTVLHPSIIVTGEETVLAATTLAAERNTLHGGLIYERRDGMRGIVLSGTTAANRGLAIKNITNTVEGNLSYIIEFTIEPT